MSGHVFHPGHEELHGVTVVVTDSLGRVYLGRYHERGPRGVVMRDVAVFDPAADGVLDEWLARQRKFGIRATHRHLVVSDVAPSDVRRLVEL